MAVLGEQDRLDAKLADKALEEIQSGESTVVSWREVKQGLYDNMDN